MKGRKTIMEENMNRRERKKIHSKNAIMEASVKLFSQKGFQESSIADIMNEADLGIGTFYNYFESKEEVLRSLLGKIIGEIQQSFAALQAESRSSAEVLEETVMLTVNILSENRFVLPLFLSAADRSAMPREASSHQGEAPAFKMIFDRIIREGQERGSFAEIFRRKLLRRCFTPFFRRHPSVVCR